VNEKLPNNKYSGLKKRTQKRASLDHGICEICEEEFRVTYDAERILDQDPLVDGFNIGWNCGETAGQTVFHAHCHLIPRKADDKNLRSVQYPLLHPWV